MGEKRRVYICDSHRPKVHGGGCCSDKGSQNLLREVTALLHQHQLEQVVEIIPTTCLSQCLTGITIRVWPDQILYGKVKQQDVEEIVTSHLIGGIPVERLRVEPTPKFVSW